MEKTTLKTLAYNTIKNKIVSCEYAPGMFLTEEQLKAELKISKTPIRDALIRIQEEGLVELKSKVGITVKPLTMRDINMCFEIRMLYEPYILEQYGSYLNEEVLEGYYQSFCLPGTDLDIISEKDYYQLDSDFHQMLIEACPNHYIKRTYALIQTQSERFRYMTGNESSARLQDSFKEHCQIISACLQKDWNEASRQMLHHLKESKRTTFELAFNNMINM
ncbi:GntR family transcriptional regulator [Lacrimispora sp.]|uniref:GntR family transcriptional regulator n=1 Tax=Lacrimispora sp. TaxID=2719234 RepID=UPI00345F2AB6